MALGAPFLGTFLSGLLGLLFLALRGVWWLASGRGHLGAEPNTSGGRATARSVGALSGGLPGGGSPACWWCLQVYPSHPQWCPFLAAVQSPFAFLLGGAGGALAGALLGLLAGHRIGRLRMTVH